MAWAEKYRQEIADIRLITWTTKIYEDGFAGELTYFKGSGEPVILELCNESDDPYDPVKESHAVISVKAETDFQYVDLYSVEDMQFKVEIYQDTDLYWVGYVDTQQYQEPYEDVPYTVEIYCTDGLSLLRNILYDDEGTYYDGRTLASQIILDILGKIGFTAFKEYVNIYEESMDDAVGDSPMDQIKIDVDIFQDMYCDEVLKELLKSFGACIRQITGIFSLYRPKELIGATVYGRYFTGAAIKSAISFTPKQYIDRNGYSPGIRQVPGGTMIIQAPASSNTMHFDTGDKKSWIKNWEFKGETFDGSDFDGWNQISGTNAIPILHFLGAGTDGVYINKTDAVNDPPNYYIYQTFALNAIIDAGTNLVFEFDYLIYNTTAATVNDVVMGFEIKQGTHYLYGIAVIGSGYDPVISWITPAAAYITVGINAPKGITGWDHFKFEILNIPENGSITIKAFCSNKTNVYLAYKNIQFYCYSSNVALLYVNESHRERPSVLSPTQHPTLTAVKRRILTSIKEIKEIVYTKDNAINGNKLNYDIILGDVIDDELGNILEQFAGSLATYITTLHYRVDTITLTGTSGTANITCDGVTQGSTFVTSLAVTAATFVTAHAIDYLSGGVIVTSDAEDIIFTSNVLGAEFTGDTSIAKVTGDLDGDVYNTTPASTSILSPSSDWNSYDGTHSSNGESKPLLEIIGDEIAAQYSRPKQLIDMALMETEDSEKTTLNLIGNFQDAVNTAHDHFRAFVANRGTFDLKNRRWQLDLIEIGEGEEVSAGYPAILDDGHHWWYDPTDLDTITKDGSDFVSAWNSKLIADRNLLQAAGNRQPLWKTPGTILFDGTHDYMKATFDWEQPEMIYITFKQIAWSLYDVILDGDTYNGGCLQQRTTTPNLMINAGVSSVEYINLPLDTWGIIRILLYGVDSKLQVNTETPITGNFGTNNMGAFTLAKPGTINGYYSNIEVADIICADIADTEENETAIYDFLVSRLPS